VLARGWPLGQAWTDKIDFQRRNEVLGRLVRGLCARVSEVVYLCWSELEAGGEPQDSPLLHAVTDLIVDRPTVDVESDAEPDSVSDEQVFDA